MALLASTASVSAAAPDSGTPAVVDVSQLALDLDLVAKPAVVPPQRSRTIAAPVPKSLVATLGTASTSWFPAVLKLA